MSVFGGKWFYPETRGTRLFVGGGGYHVAKRSSDPLVAYPEFKVQVRDLVRVVGIIYPLPLVGSVFGENAFFFRAPGCAQETCAGCPQQRYATGKPGKVQGREHVGIVEGSCGYRARGVSIRENSFYRETRGTRLGGSPCG